MEKYFTADDFVHEINKPRIITGKFLLTSRNQVVEDMDFKNILFKDVEIHGGDFVSGSFEDCTFDKVIFNKSALVGVSFKRCNFKDCTLNNTQHDFGVDSSNIGKLVMTSDNSLFPDIQF